VLLKVLLSCAPVAGFAVEIVWLLGYGAVWRKGRLVIPNRVDSGSQSFARRRNVDELATEHYLICMAVAFAHEARRVHEIGLSDVQIARAAGAAPSTVRDWFALRSSPTGTRAERIAELAEIVDRLVRVMDPDYIPVWLSKPIQALDDEKPLDLIATGQARRVAQVISGLESPGAA